MQSFKIDIQLRSAIFYSLKETQNLTLARIYTIDIDTYLKIFDFKHETKDAMHFC